jgi:hypothetical protein
MEAVFLIPLRDSRSPPDSLPQNSKRIRFRDFPHLSVLCSTSERNWGSNTHGAVQFHRIKAALGSATASDIAFNHPSVLWVSWLSGLLPAACFPGMIRVKVVTGRRWNRLSCSIPASQGDLDERRALIYHA